ncbi:MAG: DsbA family protein [Polaromonas sp.]|nr:DsbA family protein [Polaromonas sp.]
MKKTLFYLFDPLCGWCYGAAPALLLAGQTPGLDIQLMPTGLFSDAGARPLDSAFAAYAWSNDQRIEKLTGQRFTEPYRQQILQGPHQVFDSGPATLALTAVAMTCPAREHEALRAIQLARYVEGQDVVSFPALASLLKTLGLDEAAARMALPDSALKAARQLRVNSAQALMREFGARGVPTLVLETEGQRKLLDHSAAYAQPQALQDLLLAA